MGIIQHLFDRVKPRASVSLSSDCYALACNAEYVRFVLECCINLVARSFASVHFRQYINGSEQQGRTSYILNVKPNKNQNAADFWRENVRKMLLNGESLVQYSAPDTGARPELYIADSWSAEPRVFVESMYKANYQGLDKSFTLFSSSVLHFKYDEHFRVSQYAVKLFSELNAALHMGYTNYQRERARKGLLNINGYWSQRREESQAYVRQLMEKSFKPFFAANGDAVLPLEDGYEYKELQSNRESAADTRSLFHDICNALTMIFGIPANLLIGENVNSETNVDTFITTCLNPISRIIETEINAKLYDEQGYLQGSRIDVDLMNVKASSITDQAKNMDILFRMGYSVDDILRTMGKPDIGADWSQLHYVTKNYQNINEG